MINTPVGFGWRTFDAVCESAVEFFQGFSFDLSTENTFPVGAAGSVALH